MLMLIMVALVNVRRVVPADFGVPPSACFPSVPEVLWGLCEWCQVVNEVGMEKSDCLKYCMNPHKPKAMRAVGLEHAVTRLCRYVLGPCVVLGHLGRRIKDMLGRTLHLHAEQCMDPEGVCEFVEICTRMILRLLALGLLGFLALSLVVASRPALMAECPCAAHDVLSLQIRAVDEHVNRYAAHLFQVPFPSCGDGCNVAFAGQQTYLAAQDGANDLPAPLLWFVTTSRLDRSEAGHQIAHSSWYGKLRVIPTTDSGRHHVGEKCPIRRVPPKRGMAEEHPPRQVTRTDDHIRKPELLGRSNSDRRSHAHGHLAEAIAVEETVCKTNRPFKIAPLHYTEFRGHAP